MPKRARIDDKRSRQKDKLRKRLKRQQNACSSAVTPPNETTESVVPCGSMDGAVSAPPGNLPGFGLMGFPPKEEKPLARMQASPRVKMHPPAPRLPSPRGSRLFVKNVTKAPSTDSPAWVCTPTRVPGHDEGFKPCPAGQAQLDSSVLRGSSSISKDEEIKTVLKTASERKNSTDLVNVNLSCDMEKKEVKHADEILNENEIDIAENSYMNENVMRHAHETVYENVDNHQRYFVQNSECTQMHEIDCNVNDTNFQTSVQGSFHQAHPMFGDNAGTQCVANSLAGLAFEQFKSSKLWTTQDMNKILATGDELYTFLQRSSSMHSRYLLVDELPQYFECFNRAFEFTTNSTLASIINLSGHEPCYADFNAYHLYEALQIALLESNGCFVCFGGNTFLIGKTNGFYFTFDSHSRSPQGLFSCSGKSTRLLFQNVEQLLEHIQKLAISMGFSSIVECNITGAICRAKKLEEEKKVCCTSTEQSGENECENTTDCDGDSDDDAIVFIRNEENRFRFCPLSNALKEEFCIELGIQYAQIEVTSVETPNKELGIPNLTIPITGDGNCFFRAVSYCLTSTENHHHVVRSAICNHILKNENKFQSFLRSNEASVKNHVSSMEKEGNWATEIEIFALAHMLSVDIFTFSNGNWLKFSGQNVCASLRTKRNGLYLNHQNQNHYEVVLDVGELMVDVISESKLDSMYVDKSCRKSRIEKGNKKNQYKREMYRKKYNENLDFKNQKLWKASLKYKENEKFRISLKESNKTKYQNDQTFRDKARLMSKNKSRAQYNDPDHRKKVLNKANSNYRTDPTYREKIKQKAVLKYKKDSVYRSTCVEKSKQKYKIDSVHRQNVKRKSTLKYKTNDVHRLKVKTKSRLKYKTDDEHRQNVKTRSTQKYNTDDKHRQQMKMRSSKKYELNEKHKENVKQRSINKYRLDDAHKERVKKASIQKYRCDEKFREKLLRSSSLKYETDETFRSKSLENSKRYYHSSPGIQKKKIQKSKQSRLNKKIKLENFEEVINLFKKNTARGPDFACCCCHRLLFQNQVQMCNRDVYSKSEKSREVAGACIKDTFLHQCKTSCSENCANSSMWICYTCHRKIMSGEIPPEASANNMFLEPVPEELSRLNNLEQHLISLHIPFMKVMALPKGGQKNIHGPVVCVPSNLKKATFLPLKEDENLLLRVKLKRKLSYKSYYEYQFINPTHVLTALDYLKQNNKWYAGIFINRDIESNENVEGSEQDEVQTSNENSERDEIQTSNEDTEQVQGETPNEDSEQIQIAVDSCLQPVDIAQEVLDHYFDDVFNIAPAEGNNPVRMLQEQGNEAKTFPCHFPSGQFSFDQQRDKRLTLARYFNNRLMNADNRFAKDTNYIFFSQYMSELNQVIEKTQISVRKTVTKNEKGSVINSDMLRNPETLSKLLRNDEAIRFMQPIRGTPAYWSATQKDLFAMLRQLGIPTWFCSFSSAEYRWNDAISSLLKQLNDERNPDLLDWTEKNEILRSNPVTVARMFEHRFRIFQRDVIHSPSEPIWKIADFFQRVEFQQRGSPHMHCLFWVENAPKIDVDGKEAVAEFIDRYVTCAVPTENEDSELRKIVLDVQQHSKKHSKSCKKNGKECRFNFPRPPSQRTFITEKHDDDDEDETAEIQDVHQRNSTSNLTKSQAKEILLSVWNKIHTDCDGYETTEDIFEDLSLNQDTYQNAMNVLSEKLTVVLKRHPNELWTNQYNPCLLKCWDANMDIQYVLDPFSCIVYIVSYISKSEREMGMLLKQTNVEAQEGNLDAKQTLKKIGSAYLTHREVTAQEAVYRVCNLRMKEASRKVIFIPVGENPTRMTKPLSQMKRKQKDANDDLHDENDEDDEIFMTNIVERYENRPDNKIFNNICLAEFCSDYRVLAKSQVPKGVNENVFELQNSKGYVQKRTRTKQAVVRYPRFSAEKTSEKFYQSRLQLFLPYRHETQLKPETFDLYETFYEKGFVKLHGTRSVTAVKIIVETNHARFAQNESVIDEAQELYENIGEPEDAWANLCPETEKNRDECAMMKSTQKTPEDLVENIPDIDSDFNKADVLYQVQQLCVSNEEMLNIVQNLNQIQQNVFYFVRDWCVRKIVNENPAPFHIFLTGGAGTGKSQIVKAINFEASRLFSKRLSSPEALSVLLTAFTGTAAFNIGGSTIHSVFSLTKFLPLPYEPLKEQTLSEIRMKLSDLQILVIDEVSMVYKRLLYYIHERLVQIKKCKHPFGGVSVLAVGDFFQLPPVKQRKDERLYKDNASYPIDHWQDLFQEVELTEIMRQRNDVPFARALNLLRTRTLEDPLANETLDTVNDCIRDGPEDVLHVYSTNDEVNNYNLNMLEKKCKDFKQIDAKDYQKDKTSGKLCLRDKPCITKTDSLSSSLLFAVNARVMLTRNCDVKDGLVNGVMGYISHFQYGDAEKTNVTAIAVIFDSQNVGIKTGKRTKNGNMVLIERIQEEILVRKSNAIVRQQFPLKLSWACTAHKVQGMTVEKVVVNLDKTFAPGQAYVALTRVTSKDGLFIETNDRAKLAKKLYADPDVKSAMKDMKKLELDRPFEVHSNSTIVVLHNIQSLNKNFYHMKCDRRFTNADIDFSRDTSSLDSP
ncbi:uncharacterized protein LOC128174255 [Crassostrea angulata]|uniref:uncharacterized protein LOC128174255 n=1 Tax=Magallana angulata TaxID=2784310 RepID=UPI0022B15EE5|nr:uncharacterized protein LOC128174255 [Crassostrea angulata]